MHQNLQENTGRSATGLGTSYSLGTCRLHCYRLGHKLEFLEASHYFAKLFKLI